MMVDKNEPSIKNREQITIQININLNSYITVSKNRAPIKNRENQLLSK